MRVQFPLLAPCDRGLTVKTLGCGPGYAGSTPAGHPKVLKGKVSFNGLRSVLTYSKRITYPLSSAGLEQVPTKHQVGGFKSLSGCQKEI